MSTRTTRKPLPESSRPGQKVLWRNPEQARACGWEAVFGPGPFEVVRTVDHSAHGLAAGLVLRTALGDQQIYEVWLVPADAPEGGSGRALAGAAIADSPALPQGG